MSSEAAGRHRDARPITRAGVALSIALWVLHVLPSPWVELWPDTVRDFGAALSLARGEAIPLQGPPMNLGPALGPLWVWLQSLPFLVWNELTAAVMYVAAIAGLRFVLVWQLARRLVDERFALAATAAMAFPTVAVFQWHVAFNPDWVATAVTASLIVLYSAYRRSSTALWVISGLLLGAAAQMHITALVYFPLFVLVLAKVERQWARRLSLLAILLAEMLVWFVPLLWATGGNHAAGWRTMFGAATASVRSLDLRGVANAVVTAYYRIPIAAGEAYASALGLPHAVWAALLACALAGTAVGLGSVALKRDRQARQRLLLFAASFCVCWVVAVAARSFTAFWQCYFLLPVSALLMGYGFHGLLCSPARSWRLFGYASIGACIALHAIASIGAVEAGQTGRLDSRLRMLGDLRHPAAGDVSPSMWGVHMRTVGARTRDVIASAACAARGDISVHGELAYVWAASTSLDLWLHCPQYADAASIMGSGASGDWTLLTVAEAARLGRRPILQTSGIAVLPVRRCVYPDAARHIESRWYYFEQLHDRRPMTRVSMVFRAHSSEALAIYRLKPFDSRWANFEVTVNGRPIDPVFVTMNSYTYRSDSAVENTWKVSFETDAPQWVDVDLL